MNPYSNNPYTAPMPTNPVAGQAFRDDSSGAPPMASAYLIAMRVIRSIGWKLLFVYSLVWLPLNLWLAYIDREAEQWDEISAGFRVQQSVEFWIGSIVTGALIVMAMTMLDGKKPSLSSAYGGSLHRYGKVLTTRFCYGVLLVLGLVLLVVPGLYFAFRSLYAVEIAVRENVHGPTAIRRSFELTEGRSKETMGYLAAIFGVYLLATLAFVGSTFAFLIIGEFVPDFEIPEDQFWIFEGLLAMVFAVPVIFSVALAYSGYRRLVPFDERQVIS